MKKPTGATRYDVQYQGAIGYQLRGKQRPEIPHVALSTIITHHGSDDDEREEQGNHRAAHGKRRRGVLLQTVPRHYGVCHEGVAGHDAAKQKRCRDAIVQTGDADGKNGNERDAKSQQTEGAHLAQVLLQPLKVHLQTCQEHDIEQTNAPEKLERRVALQNIETVLADGNACQHHTYYMRNTQFAHHYRSEEDNEEHDEEYHRRTRYGQILRETNHFSAFNY